MASGNAIDVVMAENTVFTAYSNGLHVMNRDTEEEELLTDVNGLSDIEISSLYYDSIESCATKTYHTGLLTMSYSWIFVHVIYGVNTVP